MQEPSGFMSGLVYAGRARGQATITRRTRMPYSWVHLFGPVENLREKRIASGPPEC